MIIMQKTIIFDVDGVLIDFVEHLLKLCNEDSPELDFPTFEEVTQYDFFSVFDKKQVQVVLRILGSDAFWKTMEARPGAAKVLRTLRQYGYRVLFVTRPCNEYLPWLQVRRKQIEELFDGHVSDIVYTVAKEVVAGELIVEDNPEHVRRWMDANPEKPALMFTHAYNKDFKPRHVEHIAAWNDKTLNTILRLVGHEEG